MADAARISALGYPTHMFAGWAALMLAVAQAAPARAVDALFIAVSAVSTTRLATGDPGGSCTAFGVGVLRLLILAGGMAT